MYERFTDRARKVMRLANQEAQHLCHDYLGTEHILLGLVKEGSGVAAQVLKNLGIDLRQVRLEVKKLVKPGMDMWYGKLPQTPRAKKVIEYAIAEARSLKHNYVGTEHILLGLLREDGGDAAEILSGLGLSTEKVREATVALLNNPRALLPPRRCCNGWAGRGAAVFLFIFCGGLLAPFVGLFLDKLTGGEPDLTGGALGTGLAYIALVAILSWWATWPKGAVRA
jgi:hypothetical protein